MIGKTLTEEPMGTSASEQTNYVEKLRELIPARTLGLYVFSIGLVSALAKTPAEVGPKFGWLLVVITGVCLVVNFVGRVIEKKGWADAAISTGAFFLLTATQRFTGPFAAFGDSQWIFLLASILAAVYVTAVGWFWKPTPKA